MKWQFFGQSLNTSIPKVTAHQSLHQLSFQHYQGISVICKQGPKELLLTFYFFLLLFLLLSVVALDLAPTSEMSSALHFMWTSANLNCANLDSVAKAETMQIWLYSHTYKETTLDYVRSSGKLLCITFHCPVQQRVKTKGLGGRIGEEEASDLYYCNQTNIFKISLLHRAIRGTSKLAVHLALS